MSSLRQDLAFAWRTLVKRPGFTLIAALTLGLGIGANAALVSVVRVVLLNPLPYQEPEAVVDIWSRWEGFPKTWVSMGEFQWYRDTMESFSSVGLYQPVSYNLTDGDEPERIAGAQLSDSLLRALGVEPSLGRGFTVEESRDAHAVALLSDQLWRGRYGASRAILGESVELNGVSTRILGVLPAGFRLPLDYNSTAPSQIYTPLSTPVRGTALPQLGGSHSFYALARLGCLLPAVRAARLDPARSLRAE